MGGMGTARRRHVGVAGSAMCAAAAGFAATLFAVAVLAQGTSTRRDVFVLSRDHPAIAYTKGALDNPATRLNARLQDGRARLRFDPANGYLLSVLEALEIPVESQMLVFSPTSSQAALINMHNPRAVFYNDTAAVGWVRGGELLEIAVQDRQQGAVFYALPQVAADAPTLTRKEDCLACHLSWDTLGVPGLMATSMYPLPDDPNAYANGFSTVQGSPLTQRWGGWWVTGNHGGAAHMGNVPVMPADKARTIPMPKRPLASVTGLFDLKGFPTPYSDTVALLVLAHQTHMTNLLTRAGWEARVAAFAPSADASSRVTEAAQAAVDYMLFIDEAPLAGPVQGSAGFAEQFSARGPKDSQGRSLREFDLRQRLFRYPMSYMIYTEAFDALPPAAKDAIYRRLWEVISGGAREPVYRGLAVTDRVAITEILRETKPGLPDYFRADRIAGPPARPAAPARPVRPARPASPSRPAPRAS
jgi:hypothetical protein